MDDIKMGDKKRLINHLVSSRNIRLSEALEFFNRMPKKERERRVKELKRNEKGGK